MVAISTAKVKKVTARVLGRNIITLTKPRTGTFNITFIGTLANGRPKRPKVLIQIPPDRNTPTLFFERNMILQQPYIHRLVRQKTGIPISDILYLDAGGRHIGTPLIIYSVLPGKPMSNDEFIHKPNITYQLGSLLRQLHQKIRRKQFGYLGPHPPMSPQRTWPAAFRVMWGKFLNDLVAIGAYSSDEAEYYQTLLQNNLNRFNHLKTASLLHMDIWRQNILTDGNRITGIIDWDRCLWGDPELELTIVEKSGLLNRGFWKGYQHRPAFSRAFFIRRAFYILYEHQKHIFGYKVRKPNPAAYLEHLATCRALFKKIDQGNFDIHFTRQKPV